MLRQVSLKAYENNTSLYEELIKNREIMKFFTEKELEEILKPENYLGTTSKRIQMVVKWIEDILGVET